MPAPKRTAPQLRPDSHSNHMKLLPRRTLQHSHYHDKLLYLKKYYRWALWFSLSLYLFHSSSSSFSHSSYLLPGSTPTFLDKTTLHLKTTTSRALIESPLSSSPSLKIYVYDLPARFNRDWLSDPRCASHLFAAEVSLHEALLEPSSVRAVDPREADFFFVPVYVSCNFSTPNGFPSLRHARPLLAEAVSHISTRFPFWNRSGGRDHVFVASHDYGACFHAMEDVAIADGIPEFLRNSILLQTFGVRSGHACQSVEHVLIPPYVPPDVVLSAPEPKNAKRDIWVFFRGKMEVHPKNISGRFYGKRVRTEIWNRYSNNKRFYLRRKRYEGFREEIARAVYCLCPRGWAPWSPRLVEAVVLGCVPVIIADDLRLPFPEAVPWPEMSLAVAERDVGNLEALLDHVARTNLSAIQRNLWKPSIRQALLFHRPMRRGDATWQVLKALEGTLDRLRRTTRSGHYERDTWKS